MVRIDDTLAVAQNLRLPFDHRIGRQTALAFPDAHAAAARVEAKAHLPDRTDLLIERAVIRKDIQVIARGRATGEHELRGAHAGALIHAFRRQPRPDRIKRFQP